jgi:FG-GAP repeat
MLGSAAPAQTPTVSVRAPLPLRRSLALPAPGFLHRPLSLLSWRVLLAAAFALLALAAVLLQPVSARLPSPLARTHGSASSSAPAAFSRDGVLGLAPAARGQASAALGLSEPGYRVRASGAGFRAASPAQHLRIGFSRAGVSVGAGASTLALSLRAAGYGASLSALASSGPTVDANRVSYAHGDVREWYANGPLGLEQGFTIARALRGRGSGPLTLSLALSGDAHPALADGGHGVVFSHAGGPELRYTGLTARDATGRTLRSWLQLRDGHLLLRVDAAGARYPLRIDPFIQSNELTVPGIKPESELGQSVAVAGNTVVVGQPDYSGLRADQGAAYVYTMPAGGWSGTLSTPVLLNPGSPSTKAHFGYSVAIAGNAVVASGGSAVYVFTESGSEWVEAKQLEYPATPEEAGRFRVGISGNTIVAGADTAGADGEAFVYTMPVSGWPADLGKPNATLKAKVGQPGFGYSVAIDGSTIVVGDPEAEVEAVEEQGEAFVFTMPGAGWSGNLTQSAELIDTPGEESEFFGAAVAVSGETVAVGAWAHEHAHGGAYAFTMPAGGWKGVVHQAAELEVKGAAEEWFGQSVAVSGSTIVAGAPDPSTEPNPGGSAYAFDQPAGGWSGSLAPSQTLTPSDPTQHAHFGESVSISGATIAVGAPQHQTFGFEFYGAAYVFTATPPSIAITTPANGVTYTQGQSVAASYSCTPASGQTLSSCSGLVANGAPIGTAELGAHTFTVEAHDDDGGVATQTVSYTVVPVAEGSRPGGTSAPLAPAISRVSQSHARWREGSRAAMLSSTRKPHKPPVGTTYLFTLNEAASVSLAFTHQQAGRKLGAKCVAQTRRNRTKHACKRTVTAGVLSFAAHAGLDKISFQGLLAHAKKLPPGSYTLALQATSPSGQRSAPARLSFTIVA